MRRLVTNFPRCFLLFLVFFFFSKNITFIQNFLLQIRNVNIVKRYILRNEIEILRALKNNREIMLKSQCPPMLSWLIGIHSISLKIRWLFEKFQKKLEKNKCVHVVNEIRDMEQMDTIMFVLLSVWTIPILLSKQCN